MEEFIIEADLEIGKQIKVSFEEPILIDLQKKNVSQIAITSDLKAWKANFSIIHDTEEGVREEAILILNSVADIIAFKRRFLIESIKIPRITYKRSGDKVDSVSYSFQITGTKLFKLSNQETKDLAKYITHKFYNSSEQTFLSMYREALLQESPVTKFLLLYRLLETIHQGIPNTESFIKQQHPNIKICSDRKGDRTILTWLRDNVHGKGTRFPFKEINDNIQLIKELVNKSMAIVISP